MRHSHVRAARVAAFLSFAATAIAAEPGFVQDFNDGTLGEFVSFAILENVPSGGVGGVNDGYLRCARLTPERLGAHSASAQMTGELTADGVTGYSFWLNDIGTDDDLEIHIGVGLAFANFWVTVEGFQPPHNAWQEYSVDLTDSAGWVRIMGSGTFEQAVEVTDRLLLRHDLAPLQHEPNQIAGDFGLDRVTVLPACTAPALVPGDNATSFSSRAFDGFVDARAESNNGTNVNLGLDAFTLEFTTALEDPDGSPISADAFTISDTAGTAPGIANVTTSDGRVVTVHLTDHVAVQQRTTVTVNARSACDAAPFTDAITVGYLPADVDQSGCVSPFDLLEFRTFANGIGQPDVGVVTDYIDTDRNGTVGPFDLLAFRQLINGFGNATQPWSGECLPSP